MKKSILVTVLFIIAFTGCKKDEDNAQLKKEQISTAHYLALSALQSLPGNLGTLGQNQTNDKGDFIETNINLSSQWKAGQESNLSNQIGILMSQTNELKFFGWKSYNHDGGMTQYWGVWGFKDETINRSAIVVSFVLSPYVSMFVNTAYCEDGDYEKHY